MIERIRKFLSTRQSDLETGDLVHRKGSWGTGIVESVEDGMALVAWNKDRRDILPFGCLKRCEPGGSFYDQRRIP